MLSVASRAQRWCVQRKSVARFGDRARMRSLLKVQLLRAEAKAPTIAHPGEDLGYDIYAAEDVVFEPRGAAIVPTGIAIEIATQTGERMGALLRDKSSLASRRLITTAGVIDAGYRGEIK